MNLDAWLPIFIAHVRRRLRTGKRFLMALVALALLATTTPVHAQSQLSPPPLPMAVSGTVELPTGQPLTQSATITAIVDGAVAGTLSFQSSTGQFGGTGLSPQLIVQGTQAETVTPTPVAFTVTVGHTTVAAQPVGTYTMENPNNTSTQEQGPVTWESGAVIPNLVLQMTASPVAPLTVNTTSLPAGQVGRSYSVTLAVTGGQGPYTWTVASGSTLPPGLTLSAAGTLSGTPAASGTFTFSVSVTDSETPPHTASQALTLIVGPATSLAPLSITTASLPAAQVGQAYSATLAATGGQRPYTWTVAAGTTLPPGLTLNGNGTISGTPLEAGTFFFTLQVADSQSPPSTQTTTLAVVVAPAGVVLTPIIVGSSNTASTPATASVSTTTTAGTQTVVEVTASGGTGTVAVAQYQQNPETLPPPRTTGTFYDVSLAPQSTFAQVVADFCDLSGATAVEWWTGSRWQPVSPQSYNTSTGCVVATFSDTSSPSLAQLGGTVFAAVVAPITITTAALPQGQVNQSYTATLTASGGAPPTRGASPICQPG